VLIIDVPNDVYPVVIHPQVFRKLSWGSFLVLLFLSRGHVFSLIFISLIAHFIFVLYFTVMRYLHCTESLCRHAQRTVP